MDLWDKLRAVTMLAQDEENLPDFLAERIFTLVELSRNCKDMGNEIAELTEKVSQYDTFAQTGYIGMGVDNLILEESIKRFEHKIKNLRKE
jgi:hypothetical protein